MKNTAELLGKLTEGLATLSKTEEIVKKYKTENSSEDVKKMKAFTGKNSVYLKFDEFVDELEEFEYSNKDSAESFLKIVEKTIELIKAKTVLKNLVAEKEFEKAEELLPEVQNLRNELAKLHVEFLGL